MQMQTISDLITLTASGDLKAKKELTKRHKTFVHNYNKHYKNNPENEYLPEMLQKIELIAQCI